MSGLSFSRFPAQTMITKTFLTVKTF